MLNPRGNQDGLDYKSQYDTLTSDLGKFGQAGSALQNTLVGRYLMPFMTAPTNDGLRMMERNALLAAFMPSTYRNLFGKNSAKRQETLGRLTLGSGTIYALAHYAAQVQILVAGLRTKRSARSCRKDGSLTASCFAARIFLWTKMAIRCRCLIDTVGQMVR